MMKLQIYYYETYLPHDPLADTNRFLTAYGPDLRRIISKKQLPYLHYGNESGALSTGLYNAFL